MATKISELTTASTLDGSELIPVVQGGVTKQTSVTDLVSGGELPAYSTTETLTTERWTDGKPIYRKVFEFNFGASGVDVDTSMASASLESLVSFETVVTDSSGNRTQDGAHVADDTTNYWRVVFLSGNIIRGTAFHAIWESQSAVTTVHYTKTTDTAASPVAGVTVTGSPEYSEGTWNPILSDGTNSNATLTIQEGNYTKIGRQVHCTGRLSTSSLGSITGTLRITGLPFISMAEAQTFASGTIGYATGIAIGAGQALAMYQENGTDFLVLRVWDAATGTSTMSPANWSSDGGVIFSITYFTD